MVLFDFAEDYSLPFDYPELDSLVHWITDQIKAHQVALEQLQYIITSDEHILELNRNYLQHDYLTDILTFPYDYNPINGEIYISGDRVKDNALDRSIDPQEEFLRVLAHGALHMLRYDDKDEADQQEMRSAENDWIHKFYQINGHG